MARTPRDVTDAELGILEVLWDEGSRTIRELTDRLYEEGTSAQYRTVQKLLERLEEKGYVGRKRRESAHLFSARIDRDTLIGRRLQDVAEKLCGGSMTPLLSHLVRNQKLSSKERQELRDLIDELTSDRQSD